MATIHGQPKVEMRSGPEHLSWSQITQLVPDYRYSCPRQWAYQRLLNLPFKPSPGLALGSAFDAALNALFVSRMQGHPEVQSQEWALKAAVEEWQRQLPPLEITAEKDEAYRLLLSRGVGTFLGQHLDVVPAAVQVRLDYSVRQRDGAICQVTGWADRIDQDGTIVDHKWSGTPRWNQAGDWDQDWVEQRRDQLATYWLARRAEERRGKVGRSPVVPKGRLIVVYGKLNMASPQVRSLDLVFGPADEDRVLRVVRKAYEIRQDGRLPARPGETCSFCSFRERCQQDEERRGARFPEVIGV